jgi:hypothetical protein
LRSPIKTGTIQNKRLKEKDQKLPPPKPIYFLANSSKPISTDPQNHKHPNRKSHIPFLPLTLHTPVDSRLSGHGILADYHPAPFLPE